MRPLPTRTRDESGIALLVVLLAITLLTITVIEFTHSAQVETRLARGARNSLQAYYLARSGVNLAEAILLRDEQLSDNDSLHDVWAQPLPPLPLGDGTIMLRVQDEARFLNVNALALQHVPNANPARHAFANLLAGLDLDPQLNAALIDWLDGNETPEQSPPGAEQAFYLGLTPPVAVPNRGIVVLRELLALRGMTPEILGRLSNFVTVLRDSTQLEVNVNTAPAEVLMALAPGLAAEPGAVRRFLEARAQRALNSEGDVNDAAPRFEEIWQQDKTAPTMHFDSQYFRIEAVGTVGRISRGITTVVDRKSRQITRVGWSPRVSQLALTTLPPSDSLEALPPLDGG